MISWGLAGAADVINIHPLFVHFPIALLLAAFVFYWLAVISGREQPAIAGKWTLITGTIAAALTVWTGLDAARTVPHSGGVHGILMVHQYFGFAIAILSLFLSLWVLIARTSLPGKGRPLFLGLIIVLAGLVIQTADFGGRMVFLHGVGVGRKSMMPEAKAHEHGGQEHHEHGGHESHEHAGHTP